MAMNRMKNAFAPPKKGETFELRAGLVSQYAWERKESIQKTIMAMTLGKDVSALFPDVLKNIATGDLDQKKLVYLYLMYAPILLLRARMTDSSSGIMPNHTPISAF
jgi:AP-1 complex subunit beta-1